MDFTITYSSSHECLTQFSLWGCCLEWVCMHVCESIHVYMGGWVTKGQPLLPTSETGNGSNMGLSEASWEALGSDLGSASGPELQDQ